MAYLVLCAFGGSDTGDATISCDLDYKREVVPIFLYNGADLGEVHSFRNGILL